MTLVHPVNISGRLHLTDPFQKHTLCGVWLHPTFWRFARPPISTRCQECSDLHPESPPAA